MLKDFLNRLLGRRVEPNLGDWQVQYDALFENMPVGVSFLTRDMRYIRINPYLEKMTGLRSAEIEGKHCYDVVGMYRDDPDRKGPERICDVCGVKTALETGKPYKFTRKNRPGLIVDNMGVPVLSSDGRVIGAAEIILDVTSRVALEERLQEYASDLERSVDEKTRELRRSRSFLDNIIQSTGDAIFTLDEKGRIKFMNVSAGPVLGWPAGSLLDKPLTDLTGPDGAARVKEAIAEAEQSGKTVFNVRVAVEASDGTVKTLLMSFAPLGYQGGPGLYVCICKDITNEAMLENEKEEFLAMLTHDLKTPITSIIGYSSLILQGDIGGIGPDIEQAMKGVRTNANKMLGLVNNFLSAGRLEEGSMQSNMEQVNMGGKLMECITSMKPMFDDKALSFKADIQDGLPHIYGDDEQLERVMYNLISNAVKFTPNGGSVTARLYGDGDGHILFEVSDTGPGITDKDMPFLFDKYYRGVRANGSAGTGLGLYITRSIVESHKGEIELDSKDGNGATFRIKLPIDGG
jgi:PAS domain S-box-containing protein